VDARALPARLTYGTILDLTQTPGNLATGNTGRQVDAAAAVHRHAHDLVADSITEVQEGA
jgi:hypothetical protein